MNKMNKDLVLFKNDDEEEITLEVIFKKIYDNHETKQQHILATAEGLRPMIRNIADAVTLMPIMVQLQNASIANDDQLIKLATIVQRMQSKVKSKEIGSEFQFTDDMRNEMIKAAKEISKPGRSSDI